MNKLLGRVPGNEQWLLFSRNRYRRILRPGACALAAPENEFLRFRADDPACAEAVELLSRRALKTPEDVETWLDGRDFPSRELYEESKRENLLRLRQQLSGASVALRLLAFLSAAIMLAVLFLSFRAGRLSGVEERIMLTRGGVTSGQIIRKMIQSDTGDLTYDVRYAYETPDGKRFEAETPLPQEQWETVEPGQTVEVTYITANPGFSLPYRVTWDTLIDIWKRELLPFLLFGAAMTGCSILLLLHVRGRVVRLRSRLAETAGDVR